VYEEIKLAVIGSGKWGMNHVRTAYGLLGDNLKCVCDMNADNEEKVKEISDTINFTTELNDVLNDSEINSVIVATPAETHFKISKKCLESNKHVLVEKPITLVSEDAKVLVDIAKEKNKKLMVGHVLLYHPAIVEIKEMLNNGKLGKLQYIYSNRLNLGTVRSEENILWSFAPHDISIMQFLTDNNPVNVYAKGAVFLQNDIEDTTLTFLEYPDNVHAHIFVSWLHPFKEHRLLVIGDEGMLVFEDSLKNEKLKFYKKGYHKVNGTLEKFDNDYEVVETESKQPLTEEQKHFYDCIVEGKKPLTNGVHAVEVLEILEKAQRSLKSNVEC
jgi:UDP-2-acetamido-3-amino-2,3-dideoxy-glucuronate N-acetyltransferase